MNTRTDCSPRIIKRINTKEKTEDASKYGFYRQINHLSIIRLDNEADKLNYSSWLTRLDNETSDLKMHLIKILFISLRSNKSFQIFLKPPPDDLNDLELKSDNTMDMVKWLQDNNIADESLINEEKKQEIKHKRSAAVATNMRSYTTIKTSPYFVQSFYVRSDWPIYTWYNPTSIRLPSNYDHNQWELFLNRFQIVTEDKSSKNKHRNECDDIIPIDQVSKEVVTTFNWHPYSILASEENRPKRTAGFIVIDLDIANQQCNQQQIDDAAFAIVSCKSFPGNKILSQRMYSDTLIPDAKFIFKTTGVTIVDYSNLKLINDKKLPFTCKLKQRKRSVKKKCGVKEDKTPCPCEKPMMTIDCSKSQMPCSTILPQNSKQIIQTKPSINNLTNKNTNTVNTEIDSKFCNLNKTYQECKSNSKCLKRNVKKTKSVESCKFPREAELNVNDNNESKERKNCPIILNAGRSSFNDSSNCDWTVSSVEISMREPDRACNSTLPSTKVPNCDANCTSISLDQVTRVKPEDQSAGHCSSVQKTAATAPCQSLKITECVRESPQEHHRRRTLDNCDGTKAERTENGGHVERMSTPEPCDRYASALGSTSADGRTVGQCPGKDQNHCCPAASVEHKPKMTRELDNSAVPCSDKIASAEISMREPDQACITTPPNSKVSNCNATCTSTPLDQFTRVEPENQSAATTPYQGLRIEDSVREPPQEHHHRRSLGNSDSKNSERTDNGGRVDAVFSGGRQQIWPEQRMSAPKSRDRCASARGLTSNDGRRVGQYPGKEQNRSCPAAFAEYHPKTLRGPETSVASCLDRSTSQQQQGSAWISSDDRSDTAAAAPTPTTAWNPDVSSYSAFSDRHMAEDRSRFLTSERTVDDRLVAMRSRSSSPLPPLLPANDFHSAAAAAAANNENDLSNDSFGATSDWPAELRINRCQSCIMQTNRFRGVGDDDDDDDDNNNNIYDTESSLSTLTSSDSSIEMRLAARHHPLGHNVNYARRTDYMLPISNNDRYPYDGSLTPNLSDVSLQRGGHVVADVWPPAYDLVEDVSMPGSLVTGPWSLSMSDSRSGRIQEFDDVRASDQYHTSCSEGGNMSGRDESDGSETDDDG